MLEKTLSNVSWKQKIGGFSGLYILAILGISLYSGYAIHTQNNAIRAELSASQKRVELATNAQMSILAVSRAQAQIIAADDPRGIRKASVNTIKSAERLDEDIQKLVKEMVGQSEINELVKLLNEIKPILAEVLSAALSNDDVLALDKSREMLAQMNRAEELTAKLVELERNNLDSHVASEGKRVIVMLGIIGGIIIVLGIIVSIFSARLVTKPLSFLEKSMVSLASGDLRIKSSSAGTDEIGRTIHAMSKTVTNLHTIIKDVYDGSLNQITKAKEVADTAEKIRGVSSNLHNGVIAIKEDTNVVLEKTCQAADQLEQAADKVRRASESAQKNTLQIKDAVVGFERFQQSMENTATSTRELEKAAETIAIITKTIRDIAAQTTCWH